ncbi:bzip transcription [Venturia nashicola]|uniref:Bzip transcription n=1 Tax=Venturia nashicola TaxID=86259 RepID=A0A4Z1PUM0_9PEZI|nr:bzip transcription [Venturia nashicola]TLD38611.1 bzip transcription [Venturia nashicola]
MSDPAMPHAMPHAMQSMQKMPSPGSLSQSSKQSIPGAKRRPSRAGTRSVSTLTAAQLERKRANDREAQRAIRQRTKDHIETLERRIADLSATNDTSAKLMQALQRNEELEQENAILRGRLNHAVAALSENGISAENVMLPAAPASPNHNSRMKISNQVPTSSTPAPRSVPATSVQQSMAPQEAWNTTYSPVSSTIERSPSIADASPVAGNMRWNSQHSPVGPPIPEPERHMQPMDPALQQQQQYAPSHNYVVDTNGRPMQHHQQYQPEPQMMAPYAQARSPTGHVAEYHPGHSNAHMAPSSATAYPAYPHPQGQAYMPVSPHEPEQMHMIQQRSGMEAQQPQQQQIMYNMHSNSMKHEH